MLEVCLLSPSPAMQLGAESGDWAVNPAAREWPLAKGWRDADWQSLADAIHREYRAGIFNGEALALGLGWRAAPVDAALVAWLLPLQPPIAANDANTPAEALRRQHAADLSLDMIAEVSGVGVWTADAVLGTIVWHGQMTLLFGEAPMHALPIAEAMQRVPPRIHPVDRASVLEGMSAVGAAGFESGEWSFRVLRDDGATRWVVSRVRRLARDRGHATAGVLIDVTEQREALDRLRQAERRTAMAAEFAGFGVWQLDLVTGERFWDAQMLRLRGIDPATKPDIETVRKTTPPESRKVMDESMANIRRLVSEGRLPDDFVAPTVEFQVVWPDGTARWLSSRANVVFEEGKNPQLIGLHWDITDLKQAADLRRERAAADEANQAKGRFLANMSHEIRTPMNAILGMSHLALRTELEPRQRSYLTKIERSAKALLGLINDILDFSKIEADKIELEQVEFQLADVLEDLADLVGMQAAEKGLELRFDASPAVPATLLGDPMRLGQVLLNLVGNAVKFTERGDVVLSIEMPECAARSQAPVRLRFTVSDKGSGMTPQHLARLFEPFEQADASTSRQHGGTGLGLAISRRLVQTMGGELVVNSELGAGSSFAFEVEFAVPAATPGHLGLHDDERDESPDRRSERLLGARVLLVDDNEINQELASEILGDAGIVVTIAEDGRQAIEAMRRTPFDLVLMDCQMPVMDGYEATIEIRREPQWAGLPIIAMTANVMSGDRDRAIASGMNDHIAKPIDIDAMFATLARWLPAGDVVGGAASATPPAPLRPPA